MDNKNMKDIINQIEVPEEEVLRAIDMGIKKGERIPRKRYFSKKKLMVSSLIAVSVLAITFSLGFINSKINQVLASAPFIGEIYEKFGDKMGLQLAEQDLVTELNQTLTKNGVTVKLNNAYFDGNVVSVTGHVSGDLAKGWNEEGEVSFDVNFENYKGDQDPWLDGMSTAVQETGGGYTFQWILSYPYEEIANNITLPITIHYINGMKGEWNFDIPIKQEKGKTVVVNHLESYPNEGVSIKIKDIMIAEVSSTLEFETVSEYKQDQINFEKALDEKGNVLLHGGNKSLISRTEEKDGYRSTLRKTTSKIDEDVQSITFYPSLAIVEAPAQQLLNSSTFTLKSARSNLKIKVNSITEEDSKVTVDYQLQGFDGDRSDILKHNLAYAFTLVDNDYVDKIDPENPYPPEGHSIAKNEVKLLDKKTGHYQSVFYLNGEEKIEDFSLQNTVLQFDFNGFIRTKELAPFTVQLSK